MENNNLGEKIDALGKKIDALGGKIDALGKDKSIRRWLWSNGLRACGIIIIAIMFYFSARANVGSCPEQPWEPLGRLFIIAMILAVSVWGIVRLTEGD